MGGAGDHAGSFCWVVSVHVGSDLGRACCCWCAAALPLALSFQVDRSARDPRSYYTALRRLRRWPGVPPAPPCKASALPPASGSGFAAAFALRARRFAARARVLTQPRTRSPAPRRFRRSLDYRHHAEVLFRDGRAVMRDRYLMLLGVPLRVGLSVASPPPATGVRAFHCNPSRSCAPRAPPPRARRRRRALDTRPTCWRIPAQPAASLPRGPPLPHKPRSPRRSTGVPPPPPPAAAAAGTPAHAPAVPVHPPAIHSTPLLVPRRCVPLQVRSGSLHRCRSPIARAFARGRPSPSVVVPPPAGSSPSTGSPVRPAPPAPLPRLPPGVAPIGGSPACQRGRAECNVFGPCPLPAPSACPQGSLPKASSARNGRSLACTGAARRPVALSGFGRRAAPCRLVRGGPGPQSALCRPPNPVKDGPACARLKPPVPVGAPCCGSRHSCGGRACLPCARLRRRPVRRTA